MNEVDFQTETVDASEPSFEVEPPDVPSAEAPVTWRLATSTDMAALRVCNFQSEVEAGRELYVPTLPSEKRAIFVAEKGGRIIGGLLAEEAIVVTMIGLVREIAESADEAIIPKILAVAKEDNTRFLEVRLARGVTVDLSTGTEPNEELRQ